MDPALAAAIGLGAAREILQLMRENREITEQELATIIAKNVVLIDGVVAQIRQEMLKYGE